MSERGVFGLDRGIFDHPIFADEPFTEREAWAWMISEAAWRDRPRRIGKVVVNLKRGQLAASIRFMAERWRWSKSRVERFLDRLRIGKSARGGRPKKNLEKPLSETGTMIKTATGTGVLVITICNYDKYQRVSLPSGTATETQNETAARQQRDKREDIEDIESHVDGGGALVTREAINLANEVAISCGHDPEFVPPSWMNAAWTVQNWFNNGWAPAAILAACKETMARKRDGPPSNIGYFEKPIAKFIARQAKPVPIVEIVKGETVHVVQESRFGHPKGNLIDAAERLAAGKVIFGDRPSLGGGAGQNVVRVLPQGGRERPGDVRGGGDGDPV